MNLQTKKEDQVSLTCSPMLDLVCKDVEGNIFGIEVQKKVDSRLFSRCVYYAAGQYHSQLFAGGDYAALHPVFEIAFLAENYPHENPVALRAVVSTDAMTADWFHFPYDFLAKVSDDIINKVKGVNRVVYDISSKPPATIEWE